MSNGPRSLLVIACSARKVLHLRCGPAWDIYDGRVYQVLKKALRTHTDWESIIEVVIISARYGAISASTVIETYDDRMTTAAAREMEHRIADQLRDVLAGRSFAAVHANLGRVYREAVPDLESLIAPASIEWASGGIGLRNAQTRDWALDQLNGFGIRR